MNTLTQWTIEENHSLNLTEIITHDDAPPYVATVHHCRPDYERSARLIAAAPELLEALRMLLPWVAIPTEHDDDEEYTTVIELVHRAIAKAEQVQS